MSRGFTIREVDVFRLIIEELNNNAFSSKIKFSMADWLTIGENDEGDPEGLLINRLALSKDNQSRFDVLETYDEETYAKTEQPFVAFSVGGLNGEITALNTIKDIVYDPVITFLVNADNINAQRVITLAIEEIRYRWIQYERTLDVEYYDIDNITSSTKISETLKVIMASGTIDFGSPIKINGKQYLSYTLPVTINVTNFGEFANQQRIYLGTNEILDGGSTKMFLIEPNDWHWGTSRGIESVMLLPDKAAPGSTNNKEIKSVAKNKGFAFNVELQMDFQDSTVGDLCKWLYKDSMLEDLAEPIMQLRVEMFLYDSGTGDFVKDDSLTMERPMILSQNQPSESLSKGEKLVHSLVLTPIYNTD